MRLGGRKAEERADELRLPWPCGNAGELARTQVTVAVTGATVTTVVLVVARAEAEALRQARASWVVVHRDSVHGSAHQDRRTMIYTATP